MTPKAALMLPGRMASAALCAAVAAFLPLNAAFGDLVPHQAIYSLTLGKAPASGRYTAIEGVVRMSVEKTCDAWITAEQVKMRVDTLVGGQMTQDLDFTGWESLDGREFQFFSRSRTNGMPASYKGEARATADAPGVAAFTQPKAMTMTLPAGTRFYFGLTSWMVDQAKAGASRAETVFFDGTDDSGPQRAVAFIVPLDGERPYRGPVQATGDLLERPGWRIRLAFFPLGGRAAAPDYEVESLVLDNGVTPTMELIFPAFTAIQELKKVEALEAPRC